MKTQKVKTKVGTDIITKTLVLIGVASVSLAALSAAMMTFPGTMKKANKHDLNNNQRLDRHDATILMRVALGISICPLNKQCDLNWDEQVNALDVLMLENKIKE